MSNYRERQRPGKTESKGKGNEAGQKEGSKTGLIFFLGCGPPRSSLLQKQGDQHIELVTYGLGGRLMVSFHPHCRERQRRGKRESGNGETGGLNGGPTRDQVISEVAGPRDECCREKEMADTPNWLRVDCGANPRPLSTPIIERDRPKRKERLQN